MKLRLQFRFEDGTYAVSENVPVGTIIMRIPYLAKEYRPLIDDYRGYREGDKLRVIFLDAEKKEVESELWENWGSLTLDDFRPLHKPPIFICYAIIEKVRSQ